jgi:uncharacterized iron-regulated protein
MKTLLLTLALGIWTLHLGAQSAAPLAPGQAALNNISNQVRLLHAKLDVNHEQRVKIQKKYNLQRAAGIGNNEAGQRAMVAELMPLLDQSESYRKQIAALKLKEFNLRELYKMPDPADANKKTKL